MNYSKISLNAFNLKIIALLAMTIDHLGYFIFDDIIEFRIIGRLAFVVFAYLIANSYLYTRDKLKFGIRLLIFGLFLDLIMIITNNYVTSNIFITLGLGYFLIYFYNKKNYLLMIVIMLVPNFVEIDYSYYGLLIILFSHIFYNKINILLIVNIILIIIAHYLVDLNYLQLYSTIGIFLLMFYNHQEGRKLKYFFYLYYPLHILLIIFIRDYLINSS